MVNRLAETSSPYLLQHKDNPVDWFPWGEEALQKARTEDKPIFLSIGYSACHWCHVMEHESFENASIAAILNQHFVSIKVDREERPDLDQIYMQAVQMLTGSGGWPMSVFLSHDGKPFYGGTYWPPENRWGRPGFGSVLLAVVDAWNTKRDQIAQQSEQIAGHLSEACRGPASVEGELQSKWIGNADRWLARNFDAQHGGFGGAPKFPHAMDLALLLDLDAVQALASRREIVVKSLDKMAAGGIYDHLGGGFARYSVDERWLVPHFEKMLYDNALLAGLYADAYSLWGIESHRRVAQETLDYVRRDMTDPAGGFYSAEDADSEGEEGKFYVWTAEEVERILGPERAETFGMTYDVSNVGNFEEKNILNLPKSIEQVARLRNRDPLELARELAEDRTKLFAVREKRVRPGLDDKVLLSWNSLMITAMAKGFKATGSQVFLDSATRAAEFIHREMRRADGRLWHSWRQGKPSHDAYLDDYGYLIDALVELYQVDFQDRWIAWAIELAGTIVERFQDSEGGFFFTADDHERLVTRSKDLADSSTPSGNAMAASGLLKLAWLSGRNDLLKAATGALRALSGVMSGSPQAAGQALRTLHRFLLGQSQLILVAGSDAGEWQSAVNVCHKSSMPHSLLAGRAHDHASPALENSPLAGLFSQRQAIDGRVTLYVCHDQTCEPPCVGLEAIIERLRKLDPGASGRGIAN